MSIAILDAGAQYLRLIYLALEAQTTEKIDVLPLDTKAAELSQYELIVISGGPDCILTGVQPDPAIFDLRTFIFGICYGMQLIVKHFGGSISSGGSQNNGVYPIKIHYKTELIHCNFDYDWDTKNALLTHLSRKFEWD